MHIKYVTLAKRSSRYLLVHLLAISPKRLFFMETTDPTSMSDTEANTEMSLPEVDASEIDSDSFGTFDAEQQPMPTPISWTATKALRTPTSAYSRGIASNVSSVTCMNYGNLQDSTERQLNSTVKITPLRDLLPEDPERPYIQCPLSAESQIDVSNLSDSMNKENDSPQSAHVLSPASAFRLKRAVFESNAQAVKSPSRRQRARNVSAVNLDETPTTSTPMNASTTSMAEQVADDVVSPSEAIQNECTVEDSIAEPEVESVFSPSPPASLPSSPEAVAIAMPVLDAKHSCSPEPEKAAEKEDAVRCLLPDCDYTDLAALEEKKEALLQAFEDTTVLEEVSSREQSPVRWMRLALLLFAALVLFMFTATGMSAAPSASTALTTIQPAQISSLGAGDLVVVESEEAPFDALVHDTDAAPLSAYESPSDDEWVNIDSSLSTEGSFSMSVRYDSAAAMDALVEAGDVSAIVRFQLSIWQRHLQVLLQRYEVPRRTRALRRALRKMQREVQPIVKSMVEAVLNYNYPTNIEELQAELSVVQQKIAMHGDNIRNKAFSVRAVVYEKAPFLPEVERAVVRGAQSAQKGALTTLQQLHRVVQDNDLLPEVYVEM